MTAFLLLGYICIVVMTVTQSACTKLFSQGSDNAAAFNQIKSTAAFLLFAVMSLTSGSLLHSGTVICGCLYGALMCLSMWAGYRALAMGSMALTSMIVSFSVVLPTVYGFVFCNESVTALRLAGLACFAVALVFTGRKRQNEQKDRPIGARWLLYVFLTFTANGFCSIIQKVHQNRYGPQTCTAFMFWAMLLCFAVFTVIGLKKSPPRRLIAVRGKRFGVLSGLANAAVGYLTIRLAGAESASVLFPAISAGTILGTLAVGIVLFGEKPNRNHLVAILCGIAAVVMLKL